MAPSNPKYLYTTSTYHNQDDNPPGITYQTKRQSQEASSSNLTVLSQISPGLVEGHYYTKVASYPEVSAMLRSKTRNTARLKIRPLRSNPIDGGSVLIALNACTETIIENRVTVGQDFHKIWCLQCTVLPELIDGMYKKML